MTLHPHAGADIKTVSLDAQRVADLLGVTTEFRFNDVLCMATPGGSGSTLAENYRIEVGRKLNGPLDRRYAFSAARK